MAFVSMIEPKNIKEAIVDDNWIIAMARTKGQGKNRVYIYAWKFSKKHGKI